MSFTTGKSNSIIAIILFAGFLFTSCDRKVPQSFSCDKVNYDLLNKTIDNYISLYNSKEFDSVVNFYPPFYSNYFYNSVGFTQNQNAKMPEYFNNRWAEGFRINDSLNKLNKKYLPYNKFGVDTSLGFYDHCFCNGDTIIAWTKLHYEINCSEKGWTKKEYFTKYCVDGRFKAEELLFCVSFNKGGKWYLILPKSEHDDDYTTYTFKEIKDMKNKRLYESMETLFSTELMEEVFDFFWFSPRRAS